MKRVSDCERRFARVIARAQQLAAQPLKKWGCSSIGRAPALQAGGHRLDPGQLHQITRNLNRNGKKQTNCPMLGANATSFWRRSLDWSGEQQSFNSILR